MATQTRERIELERGSDGTYRQRRKRSVRMWVLFGIGWLLYAVLWRLPVWSIRRVARHGWRLRWHLAPLAGGSWVVIYGRAVPVLTLPVLIAVAALATWGARTGIRLGKGDGDRPGRLYLSRRERSALAEGAIGAGLWTAGEWGAAAAGVHLHPAVTYGAYVVLTGRAAWVWWSSRRPAWLPRRLSKEAKHYTGQWDLVAAKPGGLASSLVVRGTVEAGEDGDVTFDVQLAGHVDDVNDECRKTVESTIKVQDGASLPHRSVQLASIDHDVTRARVSISPARAMEGDPVLSRGIEPLRHDGSLDLAMTPGRKTVQVKRFGPSGVRHAMISGGSDGGKSNTLSRLILPGLITLNDRGLPIETCWSLDGGLGTSTPYLAAAFWLNVTNPRFFGLVIEMAYAVHLSREARRGAAGQHDWRTWEEEDPILTLLIQEARGVASRIQPRHHRMYAEMAMRARKIGISLVQESQDLSRGNIVGGEDAPEVRKQLANNGVVLAHRDGEDDKRPLAGSHDAGQLVKGVTSLPAGGGWHLPMQQGVLLAARARTLWDEIPAREAVARSATPRPLAGPDMEAMLSVPGAREFVEGYRADPAWAPSEAESGDAGRDEGALVTGPRPLQPAGPTAKDRALRVLRVALASGEGPIGKKEIMTRAEIASSATWQAVKDRLVAENLIHQPVPEKWAPGPSPEGARS